MERIMLLPKALFYSSFHMVVVSFLGLFTFIGVSTSHAASLTFAYEGVVNWTPTGAGAPSASFDAFLGETLRIEYTFEGDTLLNPDQNPTHPGIGRYTLSSMTATVGGNTYIAPAGTIRVIDHPISHIDFEDEYSAGFASLSMVTGPSIGGLSIVSISLGITDTTRTVFNNDVLPLTQPDPNNFNGAAQLHLGFLGSSSSPSQPRPHGQIAVLGNQLSFPKNPISISQPSTVPEPSTMMLFGTGIIGLVCWKYRKKQLQ